MAQRMMHFSKIWLGLAPVQAKVGINSTTLITNDTVTDEEMRKMFESDSDDEEKFKGLNPDEM